jgi:hypothetical protein
MPRKNRPCTIVEEDESTPRVLMTVPRALVEPSTDVWLDMTGHGVFKRD